MKWKRQHRSCCKLQKKIDEKDKKEDQLKEREGGIPLDYGMGMNPLTSNLMLTSTMTGYSNNNTTNMGYSNYDNLGGMGNNMSNMNNNNNGFGSF